MACWPANITGAFFLALLVFDMIRGDFGDLPYHAGLGILMVILLWVVCMYVSVSVSAGILIVPAVFLVVFLFSMWLAGKSLQNKGCCMNCPGEGADKCEPKRWKLKPRSDGCGPQPTPSPTPGGCLYTSLNATKVV